MGIKMEYSGSPVFFKDEGKLSLLGIHQLAEKENSFNMATMVTNEMIDAV
jgi:V8-like Glu-specific endopeptidase